MESNWISGIRSSGRRGRMRHVALLATGILITAIIAAGCGSGSDSTGDGGTTQSGDAGSATEESLDIAFFGISARNVYTNEMFEAMKKKAAEINVNLEQFDGEYEGGPQIRQVEDATTSGRFDAMIIMPNDAVSIVPAAEKAMEEGITVSAVQNALGTDPAGIKPIVEGLTTQVVENPILGAEETAKQVNVACEGIDPCEALLLWGNTAASYEQAKVKPFEEVLDPNVDVVSEINTEFLREEGRTGTEDALQAHPGLDVVFTTGDQMTYGAQDAIEAAGKVAGTGEGEIALIGNGASYEGVEQIRAGKWLGSFVLLPQTMGVKCLEVTAAAARGEEVSEAERGIDQSTLSPVGPEATKQSLEKDPSFKGEFPAL